MKSKLALTINSNYKKMWIWSFVDAAIFFFLVVLCLWKLVIPLYQMQPQSKAESGPETFYALFAAGIFILLIVGFILTIVYAIKFIYNAWLTVARKTDSITGGWRIFMCFLPYVQIAGYFLIIYAFASRATEKLKSLGRPAKISTGIALFLCVLPLVGTIISFILQAPSYALLLSGNFEAFLASSQNPSIVLMMFSLIFGIFQIVGLGLLVIWVLQTRAASIEIAEAEFEKESLASASENQTPTNPASAN